MFFAVCSLLFVGLCKLIILLVFSNCVSTLCREVKEAKARKIFSLGFLGNGGGEALSHCDLAFVVPSSITARIQECHITAGHALLQYIEDSLLQKGWLTRE